MSSTTDTAGQPPPAILCDLVAAVRSLPAERQRGPFRGLAGDDGLTLGIAGRRLFLSDEDAADLIEGDYLDVRAGGAGDGEVVLLPRAFAVCGGGQ